MKANELNKEIIKLREMVWLMHGCSISLLYGDDGEMQCSKCRIDFKRMSANEIKALLIKRNSFETELNVDGAYWEE